MGAASNRSSTSKSEKQVLVDAMSKNKENNAMDGERKHNGRHGIVDLNEAASQKGQFVSREGEKQKPNNVKLNDKAGVDDQRKEKRQLG